MGHGEEAFNQWVAMEEGGQDDKDCYWSNEYDPSDKTKFVKDKNFYHTRFKFKEIIFKTEGAILFQFKKGKAWVPKDLCKKIKKKKKTVLIWNGFEFNYV